jgi:hypothetical protein
VIGGIASEAWAPIADFDASPVEGIDLRSRPGKERQMQMLGDGFPLRQRQGAEVDRTAPDPRIRLSV